MFKKILKDTRGQGLVEMALILPILLLLIFGITEFGRVLGTHLILSHSAREGARLATVGAQDTEIVTRVQNSAAILDSSQLVINISPSFSTRKRGEAVTVEVEYPVTIYAPIISDLIGNPYIARDEAVMRVE